MLDRKIFIIAGVTATLALAIVELVTYLNPPGRTFLPIASSTPLPKILDLSRVTKKSFGQLVNDRFSGYHTAIDFEVFPEEENIDVPVPALCTGPLAIKQIARGYGGMIVQRCTVENEAVTVVYGHVRLSSVSQRVGDVMQKGEVFAVLGTGFSAETDGERKHLHLGIHRGTVIDTRGYISNEADLIKWTDPATLL